MSFTVSFEQFKKDPIKAVLFLALAAIIYLYIDNKMVHKEQKAYFESQLNKKEIRIGDLEKKVDELYKIIGGTR
jgi:hypothetical protein